MPWSFICIGPSADRAPDLAALNLPLPGLPFLAADDGFGFTDFEALE